MFMRASIHIFLHIFFRSASMLLSIPFLPNIRTKQNKLNPADYTSTLPVVGSCQCSCLCSRYLRRLCMDLEHSITRGPIPLLRDNK
jgi:hypothetical protein